MNKEFRLPDVGEGLTEADIVSWHVKPGDTVTINQIIVDIETAKAVVELPSPYAGTVSALLVEEGQTVDVGTPIIAVDVPGDGDDGPSRSAGAAGRSSEKQAPAARARQPVLVGYGVKPGSTSRRPRKRPPTRPGSYPATPSAPPTGGPPGGGQARESGVPRRNQASPGIPVPPSPARGESGPTTATTGAAGAVPGAARRGGNGGGTPPCAGGSPGGSPPGGVGEAARAAARQGPRRRPLTC